MTGSALAGFEAYRGKRVVVTGADGFIGSHLVERLVGVGAKVRALCYYNSLGSRGWLDGVDPSVASEIDFVLGDVRDAGAMNALVEGAAIVFHLAALIAIPYSYRAPESFFETNVRGTLHVLEAARRHGTERIVLTSTSEVYGTPATLPIVETHPLQGQSPYSASKIAADKLGEAYACSFDAPIVTLRPFNTYGPRQSARAVLPSLLEQLLRGARTVRLGSLSPRRDLTFVADTVDGFLRAGVVPGIEGTLVQLGTGRSVSIGELVAMAQSIVGSDADVVQSAERVRPERSEVMVLESSPALAKELLGWEPRVTLEDGVRQTVDWMRGRLAHYRPGEFVL